MGRDVCVWVALVGFEGEEVDKGEAAEAEGIECVERERTVQTTPSKVPPLSLSLSLSLFYQPNNTQTPRASDWTTFSCRPYFLNVVSSVLVVVHTFFFFFLLHFLCLPFLLAEFHCHHLSLVD